MKYRKTAIAALVAVSALALSACSSGGTSDDSSPAQTNSSGYPDYSGKTLKLLQYESDDSAMGKAWKAAAAEFEKETGGKIDYQTTSFEDINSTASQLLASSDAPDILEYNKGNGTAGQLVTLGLVKSLNDYYDQYGWGDKLADSLKTTTQYSDKGIMGSGDYYGVPNYGEFVFLYYNKDMLDAAGLPVPTTQAELESDMQALKDSGVKTPMVTAAQEYPAGQLWYQLVLNKADRNFVNAYQLYTDTVDFSADPIKQGTQTMSDWISKGYLNKAASGMKAEDAGLSFINGESPFFYSGSWWYGRMLTDVTKFQFGITDFPGSTLVPGSSGNLWMIPTVSKNADMAAYFIDITMRPDIQAILGNGGGLPVAANSADITDPQAQTLIDLFNKVNERDGLSFYPDWPTSTFYDDLNAAMQGLFNGSLDVDATNKQLQSDYDKGTAQYR